MKRFLVTLALVFLVAGCDSTRATTQFIPIESLTEQQWQREDAITQRDKLLENEKNEYARLNDGYNGAFACHTSDGGCLHMSCTNKLSCDYMALAEKRCALPSITDLKVLDKLIVKDDKCESVEQPPPLHTEMTVTGTTACHSVGNEIVCN